MLQGISIENFNVTVLRPETEVGHACAVTAFRAQLATLITCDVKIL